MTSLQFSHLDKTIEWTKVKLLMNQFWHLDSPGAADCQFAFQKLLKILNKLIEV